LARAAAVLVRRGGAFKFATDIRRVMDLAGAWYDRGGSAKFITVYPVDDEQFRQLAHELDKVTSDLSGPRILSDKQLHPDSLVHYRYGEFSPDSIFTEEGVFESRMVGPGGSVVKDERPAWFSPPSWAPPPFPDRAVTADVAPKTMLLMDRFRVTGAIRHANKGGVYRAIDELDGSEVIVKQARAHVGARLDGTDVRDRLREEARMLDVLASLSITPAKVALFDQQDDLFLIQESIPGVSLHQWAKDRTSAAASELGGVAVLVQRLIELMRLVHQAGFVIRDFKPQNVMVLPSQHVRLIDVECVAKFGQRRTRAVTPGFAAPEVIAVNERQMMSVPQPSSDLFSLGVTLFCMMTALSPTWVRGRQGLQRSEDELKQLLDHIATSHPLLNVFADLIVGLTRQNPDERWSLKRAEEFVRAIDAPAISSISLSAEHRHARMDCSPGLLDRILADSFLHMQRSMTPHEPMLWEKSAVLNHRVDPCNAWQGAAGPLATLTHAARVIDSPPLRETVTIATRWIDERLFDIPRLLPGLCFGRSGTAWALHDAAQLLGDEHLVGRALELVRELPAEWHSADITHGLSGAGMACLHLWQVSGAEDLRQRAVAYADNVLTSVRRSGEDWLWPRANADSRLSDANVYGFAHGVAGAGAFLLAATEAVSSHERNDNRDQRFLQAAIGAGDTLIRAARIDSGAARWPVAVGSDDFAKVHWCGGSAGIGSFLIRLWVVTGDDRFANLAEQAAGAVHHNPWQVTVGACCGLAGGGHFLLDMAEFTGEERFRGRAEELASVIYAQRSVHEGLELVCEPNAGFDYGNGFAGVLSFLLRLRHGGPAPWMPRVPPQVVDTHQALE
jgi:serine/threonine protein kinase